MDKAIKAMALEKAATLKGWADTLRNAIAQAGPSYGTLRERIEAIIQEMEDRGNEWEASVQRCPRRPLERN